MLAFMQSAFEFVLNKFCLQLVILLGCDVRKLTLSKIISLHVNLTQPLKKIAAHVSTTLVRAVSRVGEQLVQLKSACAPRPASYLGQLAGPKA